jgi:beta-N-acetylhexosaminidase
LSAAAIGRLRRRLPDTLLITDDMQMQGLQRAHGTREASLRAMKAGMDLLCIGNNLLDQEREMADIADAIGQGLAAGTLDRLELEQSIARVRQRKALLEAA